MVEPAQGTSMESDSELLIRIRTGQGAALEVFYQRYMPALWRYIRARLPSDEAAAQDVLSETFLAAIRDLRRFNRHKGSVAGWLTGIARHKLADLRRGPSLAPLQADVLVCPSSAPSDPMRHRELQAQVSQALLLLDDEERTRP